MLVEKFIQRFSFIAQQRANCNRGENQRKKIVSGRGGKLPPVIRFKSGIDRVTFELDAQWRRQFSFLRMPIANPRQLALGSHLHASQIHWHRLAFYARLNFYYTKLGDLKLPIVWQLKRGCPVDCFRERSFQILGSLYREGGSQKCCWVRSLCVKM